MMLTYWLPLAVLAIAYCIMGIRLGKDGDKIGNENETQIKRKEKNRKVSYIVPPDSSKSR